MLHTSSKNIPPPPLELLDDVVAINVLQNEIMGNNKEGILGEQFVTLTPIHLSDTQDSLSLYAHHVQFCSKHDVHVLMVSHSVSNN